MIDTDSILHPENFSESVDNLIAETLISWDKVRDNFDLISIQIGKVINKIIRKQNEIHARVEQKRPWANARYDVVKFDNAGDTIKAFIVDSREVITGEKQPMIKFEVKRVFLTEAHKPETFEKYFADYEANLVSSVALRLADEKLIAEQMLKIDFEKARDFYLQYKDQFESEAK